MIELSDDVVEFNVDKDLKESIELFKTVGSPIRNIDGYGKWLNYIFKNSCLSTVKSKHIPKIALDKTKLTIFVILLDDIADDYRLRDRELLEKGLHIPYDNSNSYSSDYLQVTNDLWNNFFDSISSYPRFDEFRDLFFFDLDQFLTSIRYAFLSNEMDLSNDFEDRRYLPHNFLISVHGDIDLMHSKGFNLNDLSVLRPVFYWAQDILHIGNVIRTYPREIRQKDYSSPIISLGLREGVVSKNIIENDPDLAIKKLKPLISVFEDRADAKFKKMRGKVGKAETVNIRDYINKVNKIYQEIKTCKYSVPEEHDE